MTKNNQTFVRITNNDIYQIINDRLGEIEPFNFEIDRDWEFSNVNVTHLRFKISF